jgi:diacylglycerol kinase (ATP)
MKYSTIAVIYNPNSTGSSETMAKNFADSVREKVPTQKVELIATKYAGHAEKLAYKLAKDSAHPLIISSSGDGGYNEVINGALKAQNEGAHPTTGLLPAGNANDHFHNLHNEDLIKLITKGITKKIDVLKMTYTYKGKVAERYAHSYIGFGLTPIVGKELNKTKLTILNEAWVVGRALLSVKSIKLKIGKKARHYDSVIFSNVDKMSKYLKISQPSHISDGKFEVTIFKRRNKIKLIALLLKASLVGLKEDDQVSTFMLETTQKTIAQADGEILTIDASTTVTITAEKQLLSCVI